MIRARLAETAETAGAGGAEAADAAPRPFVVRPAPPGFGQRLAMLFTRAGRVRLRLANAYAAGDRDDAFWRTVKLYRHALQNPLRDSASDRQLLAELQTFLAASALARRRPPAAVDYLEALDKAPGTVDHRATLRSELLAQLRERHQSGAWLDQACRLLAQPNWETFVDLAKATLDDAYATLSSEAALRLLGAAAPSLRESAWALAARAVCECPAFFRSQADAQAWAARAQPDALRFSRALQAQALVIAARAAEWSGRMSAMSAHAAAAFALDPARPGVSYWMQRAQLQADAAPVRVALAQANPAPPDTSPSWQRLRQLQTLRDHPDAGTATTLLHLIDNHGTTSELEVPERALVLKFLRWAVPMPPASAPSSAEIRLCNAINDRFGNQPWTDIAIAFDDCAKGAYEAAAARLERWNDRDATGVGPLLRVARVLCGAGAAATGDTQAPADPDDAADRLFGAPVGLARIENRWFEAVPALAAARDVVRILDQVVAGAPDARQLVGAVPLPRPLPAWVAWLHARAVLLVTPPPETVAPPEPLDPALAWDHELWACDVLPPTAQSTPAVRAARFMSTGSRVLAQRAAVSLGDLGLQVLAREADLEDAWRIARRHLARGETQSAVEQLTTLGQRADRLCPLSRAIWRPLLAYWQGVALAHAGSDRAAAQLALAAATFMREPALAQLALLAIRSQDLVRAQACLDPCSGRYPAARYARALLHARRDEQAAALALLEQDDADLPNDASPYVQASRRLHAALLERTGRFAQAARAHADTLAADPTDTISAARLLRHRVRQAYDASPDAPAQMAERAPAVEPLLARLASDPARVPWAPSYAAAARLAGLTSDSLPASLDALPAGAVPDGARAAWTQWLVHALVAARRWREAMPLAEQNRGEAEGAACLLAARAALSALWQSSDRATLQQLADRLRGLPATADDGAVTRTRTLVQLGLRALDGQETITDDATWSALRPWPIADVVRLWHGDASERGRAADALLAACDGTSAAWCNDANDVVVALAHHVRSDEDGYRAAYARLAGRLDTLPVDGPALWRLAAGIDYRRADWKALLETAPPDCVAALEDPRDRLLIGCAYARRAAADLARGAFKQSQAHTMLARETLAPLRAPAWTGDPHASE